MSNDVAMTPLGLSLYLATGSLVGGVVIAVLCRFGDDDVCSGDIYLGGLAVLLWPVVVVLAVAMLAAWAAWKGIELAIGMVKP